MSLRQEQSLFAIHLAKLILHAESIGYEVTLGDAYRDPRVHGDYGVKKSYGHSRSFHKKRLAQDLNLFKDGKYLSSTEAHRTLGEWWEDQHDLCTWGGEFSNPDGNHYSFGEDR